MFKDVESLRIKLVKMCLIRKCIISQTINDVAKLVQIRTFEKYIQKFSHANQFITDNQPIFEGFEHFSSTGSMLTRCFTRGNEMLDSFINIFKFKARTSILIFKVSKVEGMYSKSSTCELDTSTYGCLNYDCDKPDN